MRTLVIALLGMCVLAPPVAAAPNVLIIMTDDMAASDLAEMPRVKIYLAQRGLTFTQFLVTTSLCCPSRATLLRGQYVHNHLVLSNSDPDGGWPLFQPLENDTLATRLQGVGYRTGYIGKYLNEYRVVNGVLPPVPPGWTTWSVLLKPTEFTDPLMQVNGAAQLRAGYQTDVIAEDAEAFLRTADPSPWFAVVSPYAPHAPAIPAPRHAGLYAPWALPRPPNFNEEDVLDKPSWVATLPKLGPTAIADYAEQYRRRLESLQAVDEMVERLVNALDETGQLANTFVMFTSDNGFRLGQHRLFKGKRTAYDEDVRVPLVVRGPGIVANTTTDTLAANVDLADTVLFLAGVPRPEYIDGRTLTRAFRGETLQRRLVLLQHLAVMDPADRKYVPRYRALRTHQYLYVAYENDERELYDRKLDPFELLNIASLPNKACVVDALHARLTAMAACAGVVCRLTEEERLPKCAR